MYSFDDFSGTFWTNWSGFYTLNKKYWSKMTQYQIIISKLDHLIILMEKIEKILGSLKPLIDWVRLFLIKVEKTLKGSLDSIPSPLVKIQIMSGIVCLRCNGKTLLALSTNFWKQKVCWHHPAMFCLITLSKLSRQ